MLARKLLGWVIILASLGIGVFPLALTIIRAAHRKNRYRSVYGGRAYATPFAAFGNLHAEGGPQEATRSAPSDEHELQAHSGNSMNGSDSLDDAGKHTRVRRIARSTQQLLLRTRNRGAGRSPRDPTVPGAWRQAGCEGTSTERRKRMVGDNPKLPSATDEWEVDGALRRSLEGLLLQPGTPTLTAVSELKPHVEDALQTLALLQRHRPLSDNERRQADTLRALLTSIEHLLADQKGR